MPKLLPRHYGKILYEATKDVPAEKLDEAVRGFLQFVAGRHVFNKIEAILENFVEYARKQEGRREIEIISARPLAQIIIEKIKKQFGKKVEAETYLDESLIGGIKVKVDSLVLDGSVRTQLARLKERLLVN